MADGKGDGEVSKEAVLAALSQIEDPDLRRDIVSLGFVKDEEINVSGGSVSVRIVLTTPACPVREKMKAQAEELLLALPGIDRAEVKMDAEVRSTTMRGQQPVEGVRNVIAVASNKGGVGKSTVAVNLALALTRFGARVGLMDADLTGPNLPTMMGLGPGFQGDTGLSIVEAHGVKLASIGFVLKKGLAVVWRGPMIGTGVRQLLHDLPWGEDGDRDDAELRFARGRDEGGDDVREAERPRLRRDREHELLRLPALRGADGDLRARRRAGGGGGAGAGLPGRDPAGRAGARGRRRRRAGDGERPGVGGVSGDHGDRAEGGREDERAALLRPAGRDGGLAPYSDWNTLFPSRRTSLPKPGCGKWHIAASRPSASSRSNALLRDSTAVAGSPSKPEHQSVRSTWAGWWARSPAMSALSPADETMTLVWPGVWPGGG